MEAQQQQQQNHQQQQQQEEEGGVRELHRLIWYAEARLGRNLAGEESQSSKDPTTAILKQLLAGQIDKASEIYIKSSKLFLINKALISHYVHRHLEDKNLIDTLFPDLQIKQDPKTNSGSNLMREDRYKIQDSWMMGMGVGVSMEEEDTAVKQRPLHAAKPPSSTASSEPQPPQPPLLLCTRAKVPDPEAPEQYEHKKPQYWCWTCSVDLMNAENLWRHHQGSYHKNRVALCGGLSSATAQQAKEAEEEQTDANKKEEEQPQSVWQELDAGVTEIVQAHQPPPPPRGNLPSALQQSRGGLGRGSSTATASASATTTGAVVVAAGSTTSTAPNTTTTTNNQGLVVVVPNTHTTTTTCTTTTTTTTISTNPNPNNKNVGYECGVCSLLFATNQELQYHYDYDVTHVKHFYRQEGIAFDEAELESTFQQLTLQQRSQEISKACNDEARIWQEEFDDVVVELALHNYETFHKMAAGTATYTKVYNTSAGIQGWAACIFAPPTTKGGEDDNAGEKEEQEEATKKAPPPPARGDEEENRMLRLAMMESMLESKGVCPPCRYLPEEEERQQKEGQQEQAQPSPFWGAFESNSCSNSSSSSFSSSDDEDSYHYDDDYGSDDDEEDEVADDSQSYCECHDGGGYCTNDDNDDDNDDESLKVEEEGSDDEGESESGESDENSWSQVSDGASSKDDSDFSDPVVLDSDDARSSSSSSTDFSVIDFLE